MPVSPYVFQDGVACTCRPCTNARASPPAPTPTGQSPCMCSACSVARGRGETGCLRVDCPACARQFDTEHAAAMGRQPSARYIRCSRCQEQGDACRCYTCSGCTERRDRSTQCAHCHMCRNGCCECVVCPSCSRRLGRSEDAAPLCTSCGYCDRCCSNNDSCNPNSGKFWGEPSPRFPRFVGIEIECGLDRIHTSLRAWEKKWGGDIKGDGSVHVEGKEYSSEEVVSGPARGEKFVEEVQELCKALHASGAAVDRSCGYHCHVDVRDMNDANIVAIQAAYIRVEPALYGLVARSRRDNTYSKALGVTFGTRRLREIFKNCKTVKEKVERFDTMYYGSLATATEVKRLRRRTDARYHGLNVNSIPIHGTIEFRLHQGTVNPTKILMWAAICSAIVEYGRTHTDDDVRTLRGSSISVLEQIINDPEIIAWTRARRLYFHQQERINRGVKPLKLPQKILADIRNVPSVPDESGESERSIRTGRNRWQDRSAGTNGPTNPFG